MKRVLDATCGSRMIWFDKNNNDAIYLDNRVVNDEIIWTSKDGKQSRRLTVNPDVIADFTDMPFESDSFYLVVFDPPHLVRAGEDSWLNKKYGRLEGDWPSMIRDGFNECMRVLKPNGVLIFKWAEVDIKIKEIISIIGKDPLFGNRSGKHMSTHWMVFMKDGDKDESN